jgi:hypothetical protein
MMAFAISCIFSEMVAYVNFLAEARRMEAQNEPSKSENLFFVFQVQHRSFFQTPPSG